VTVVAVAGGSQIAGVTVVAVAGGSQIAGVTVVAVAGGSQIAGAAVRSVAALAAATEPEACGLAEPLSTTAAVVAAVAADRPSTKAATLVARVVCLIRDIVILRSRGGALTLTCRYR